MEDKEYRQQVAVIFEHLAASFDMVDPDLAEAELSQGALTIATGKSKIILSPQPPVQQIWFAAASLGVAVHFNYSADSDKWTDDKGRGLELFSYLEEVLEKTAGLRLNLSLAP